MKPKVLHLLVSDHLSGAEKVAISIIKNLSDDFDFIYVSKKGTIEKDLKEQKINYRLLDRINLSSIKKVIKEEKPDIIHAHDYFASTYAAMSGFNGKIISHMHSDITLAKKWNRYMAAFSLALKKIDKVIFVSSIIPKNVIYKNKLKNKSVILPNIVDKEKLIALSKAYNTNEKYDVIYLGRLEDEKNPLAFIEIIKTLASKKPDISAVVLGNGSLEPLCKKKAKEYNLLKNITFKGYLNNPYPIVKNAGCVVMPSKYEGLGLAAIESLILEKPVFYYYKYYKNSGMSEIYDGKKNNFTCDSNEEMANNILNFLENPIMPDVDLKKFTDKNNYYSAIKKLYL